MSMKLEEGEVICPQCEGTGKPNNNKFENFYLVPKVCDKCHGSGKLDWIENIVGKKEPAQTRNMKFLNELYGSFSHKIYIPHNIS